MFRDMRRIKQALTKEECIEILCKAPRGVMAVHGENGYPYAFPLNFVYFDEKLYFHCAKEGHKLDAIQADPRVSFCIMDEGYRIEGEWPWHIRSVILFGKVRMIENHEEVQEIIRHLAFKYYPSAKEAEREVRMGASRALILELSIDHMSGKLVKES